MSLLVTWSTGKLEIQSTQTFIVSYPTQKVNWVYVGVDCPGQHVVYLVGMVRGFAGGRKQ